MGKGMFMNVELIQPPTLLKVITIFLRICFPVWFWHRVCQREELLGDLEFGNKEETSSLGRTWWEHVGRMW